MASNLNAIFAAVPMEVPSLTRDEIAALNVKFLEIVVKKGTEKDELPVKKFMYFYENIMPPAYRLPVAAIGKKLASLFKNKSQPLTARAVDELVSLFLFAFFPSIFRLLLTGLPLMEVLRRE